MSTSLSLSNARAIAPRAPLATLESDLYGVEAGDRDLILPNVSEIVLHLHSKPGFRTASEGFGEAYRHFGRDSALSVYQIIECLPGHSEDLCPLRYGQAHRLQAVLPDDTPGMGRFFISIIPVIVFRVVAGVDTIKTKRNPAIRIHCY